MIYWFSGTGNSRWVASSLQKELGAETAMVATVKAEEEVPEGKEIGFVFPVYSWGVPPIILDFIRALPEGFIKEVKEKDIPVWAVMTCGDEVALAPEMFKKSFESRGITVESIWSVIMPNDYVLLPGFDVDSKELEGTKLNNAIQRVSVIAEGIKRRDRTIDVTRGNLQSLKTKLIYPLFKKWGISPRKWRATSSCVGCAICARSCPLSNINMSGEKPVWGDKCCSCLACYHSCPHHAVEYGKRTNKKGQYLNPIATHTIRRKN